MTVTMCFKQKKFGDLRDNGTGGKNSSLKVPYSKSPTLVYSRWNFYGATIMTTVVYYKGHC